MGLLSSGLLALGVLAAGSSSGFAKPGSSIDIIPTITQLSVSGSNLVASGTATAVVGRSTYTTTFTNVPVNLRLAADQTGAGACPILDLELAPIHLDLLGLVVDTSAICLQITAYENGGLLGSLLCSVANLLGAGVPLDQILAGQAVGFTTQQVQSLLGGVTNLLNNALDSLLGGQLLAITDMGGRRYCDILNLALGPVELTLLGLEVILDNCQGGPVTVDITGDRQGGLLGNLLCSLLDGGAIPIGATLTDIINLLLRRLGV